MHFCFWNYAVMFFFASSEVLGHLLKQIREQRGLIILIELIGISIFRHTTKKTQRITIWQLDVQDTYAADLSCIHALSLQGTNFRHEHCFNDEDSMQWLKRTLEEIIHANVPANLVVCRICCIYNASCHVCMHACVHMLCQTWQLLGMY